MKICIFGVAGFIGSSLKNHFLSNGHSVIGVTSQSLDAKHDLDFEIYNYDHFGDADVCADLLADVDAVFYMCSPNQSECEANPRRAAQIVIEPLISLLRAKNRLPETRLVYFSTAQVFNGLPRDVTIDDASHSSPNNHYGLFHLFAEQLLDLHRARHDDRKSVAVRLTNSFGFLCDSSSGWQVPAVNEFIHSAATHGEMVLRSDGSPIRDFIEMAKLMDFCEQLARADELPPKVLCASGVTVNLSFVVENIKRIFDEEYGQEVKIIAPSKLVGAAVSEKPRFLPTSGLINQTGSERLYEDLKKSIADYKEFC